MTIKNLITCFQLAIGCNSDYIAIVINTRGSESDEVIINHNSNFKSKLEYYIKSYNDDLILKTYDGIKITNFTHGSINDIISDLELD